MIGPAWDLGAVAFGWVPFYLWLVFGLGLGGDLPARAAAEATALAVLVALAISYVHRHYTFLVVYGDREVLSQRATYHYENGARYWYETKASVTSTAQNHADRFR